MTQQEFFKRFTYSVSTDRIGGGGFGTVYKAKDHVLHRTVAIKVSEVKTTADGQKTFSLKDEFEALNHVPKHPNIANYEEFYSFEMPNGVFDYAVMQYYPDGNLSNAIKQGLTAKQKEDIATRLLEGIAFLHEHKVVHRDLKPGNVLIVRDGENMIPLITDFGLSKAASMDDGSVFSNSFGGGTQRYSSPEQLQGKPLRLNTDLWSFGAILYEIFTGDQLFSAGSGAANTAQADLEIYNKIIHGDVSNLGKMPEKWRKVAERCLVVDADKRAKDEKELFRIISGEAQEDETVTETVSSSDGEGTIADDKPSTKDPHSGLDPLSPSPTDKPRTKKGLWVGLSVAATEVALLYIFASTYRIIIIGLVVAAVMVGLLVGFYILRPNVESREKTTGKPKLRKGLWIGLCVAATIMALLYSFATTNPTTYCRIIPGLVIAAAMLGLLIGFFMLRPDVESKEKLTGNPKSKKPLWIALGAIAAVAVFLVLLLKPKTEEESLDTQAYNACQTVADYRAYLTNYGRNAEHYDDAKAFVDQYVADSLDKAQQPQRPTEIELAEDEAYKKCTTIAACDKYLKAYPKGKYVEEVKAKKAELEKETKPKNGIANGHEWVDLGLPSGTLWATCNVGASKPEDYGNYYAWGEKTTYSGDSYEYKYAEKTSMSWVDTRLTKYCNNSDYGDNGFADKLTSLQTDDDPAATWGSGWHTPDEKQWEELLENTTNKWTTQNGEYGRLFTAKNGNTIFLPAAGSLYYIEVTCCIGYYWSRLLCTSDPRRAWGLYFDSDGCGVDTYYRGNGQSVRPVRSAR